MNEYPRRNQRRVSETDVMLVWSLMSYVYVQLTDNVRKSTAAAIEMYHEDCRVGILRQNNRTIEEALAVFNMTGRVTDVDRGFGIQDEVGRQLIAQLDATCPACRSDTNDRQCCGNGVCVNSVCVCSPGMFTTVHCLVTFSWFCSFE